MNESQIKERIQLHNEFINYVNDIFVKYIIAHGKADYLDENTIHFEDNNVYGSGWEPWQYGEKVGYSMPISMLWQPDLIEAINQERLQKEEKERIKREKEAEARKIAQEQAEKAQYLRLKSKYEGENK